MLNRGFTLIEILIVTAILAGIGFTVLPNFLRALALKDLSASADRVLAVLRDAQNRSLAAENQKIWGVKFDVVNKNYSMSTYVSGAFESPITFVSLKNNLEFRDPANPANPASAQAQVVFSSLTGKPTPNNPVTIIIGLIGEASNYKSIVVNTNGTLEIQ